MNRVTGAAGDSVAARREPPEGVFRPRLVAPATSTAAGPEAAIRTSVVVADDDVEVRDVLADLIAAQPDLEMLALAADHATTLQLVKELHPDVVLMDVRMPGGTATTTVRALKEAAPTTAVVALSAHEDPSVVHDLLGEGAAGYQVKGASDNEILDAIRRAARGQLSAPTGLVTASIGVHRDVADRRDLEKTYGALIEAIPQAILVCEDDGRILLANSHALHTFGYRSGQLIGRPLQLLLPHQRHRSPAAPPGSSPRTPTRRPAARKTVGRRRDGRDVHLEVTRWTLQLGESLFLVFVVGDVVTRIGSQQRLEESLRRLEEIDRERQRLLSHVVRAEEEERKRIAAGIHDDTIQVITAASLRLQQLRRRLTDQSDRELLERLEDTLRAALGRLRHLVFDLRPPDLERRGLMEAVQDSLRRLSVESSVNAQLVGHLDADLSFDTQVIAYRLIEEALTNVHRHSRANEVRVRMSEHRGGLLVQVDDDGVGYDSEASSGRGHLGLTLMKERAEVAGGWCRTESRPGYGAHVRFWLPRHRQMAHQAPRPCGPDNTIDHRRSG